jgi:hypothetical protein
MSVKMRLTGHGTITDIVIVLAIMIAIGLVASFIIRVVVYGELAIDMIAPAEQVIYIDLYVVYPRLSF